MADAQTAIFLDDKILAKAMTSDLEKVEGKLRRRKREGEGAEEEAKDKKERRRERKRRGEEGKRRRRERREEEEEEKKKKKSSWYFKESALIDRSKFTPSNTHTTCPWKGTASYFNYTTDEGKDIKDIAWYYPTPKPGAEQVAGRVAFYVGKVPGLKVGVPPVI